MLIKTYIKHLQGLKNTGSFGRLALEISIALIIKMALLWLIWSLCFSNPIPKDARQSAVTRMILNNPNP